MKRLYYLADSLTATRQVSDDLHDAGINDWHFHVVSRDAEGLYRHHIHSATPLERLDIIHSGERGALLGGGFGLALASLLLLLNPPGFPMDLKLFALISVICSLLGTWIGGVGGLYHQNYRLRGFRPEIDAGRYLIMVDIRRHQERRIKQLMSTTHPDVRPAGEGSSHNNPLDNGDTAPKTSN